MNCCMSECIQYLNNLILINGIAVFLLTLNSKTKIKTKTKRPDCLSLKGWSKTEVKLPLISTYLKTAFH